ncbi:GDSL esterase/lipase At5g45950-like [Magnolia sinica]|uniref:GDSL esterase/lipase At5g45950-like n=1 Tax=Magnolia sinica TaxID=86752 RepID=UPI0026596007|nr:GDSL esterase/lipase At5g45950-like [Magnolia sinica]
MSICRESGMVGLMLLLTAVLRLQALALNLRELRLLAVEHNITCALVFGDSTVDPGNNNHLATTFKSDFPPYGKDFFGGRPTGRFTNGRLPTDLLAEEFGISRMIPAFLDKGLKKTDLLHGVSFASAGSGYDDLTAHFTNVLPFSKQIEYLMHYQIHLRALVGEKRAAEIVSNAVFVLSAGTNDFIQNYYLEPTRAKQFTLDGYLDYLISCMSANIKEMHKLGGTRFAVVGVPPMGCLPLVKTLMGTTGCVDSYNKAAESFNSKIKAELATLKKALGVKTVYADCYGALLNATMNPMKYGFTETSKGCCGSGVIEFGGTCKGESTCEDTNKYVFWDSVHPTERMYRLIADDAIRSLSTEFFA